MMILGLTGSFGAGKTYVASIFRSLGADVMDADKIAHHVIEKRSICYRKMIALFGRSILDRKRNISRKKVAEIVFNDNRALKKLNAIIHPEVIRSIKDGIKNSKKEVIVIDAPLLIEAGLTGLVDALIVVRATRKIQFVRCAKKFGMKKEKCMKRIRSQMPIEKKIKMADFIVDNSGPRSETKKQVMEIWRSVWR